MIHLIDRVCAQTLGAVFFAAHTLIAVAVLPPPASAQFIWDNDGEVIVAIRNRDATALRQALRSQTPNVRSTEAVTALIMAVETGIAELVKELLEAGARTDTEIDDGRTALTVAATRGDVPVARLLLEAGADPDVVGSNSETPLIKAVRNRHKEMVRLLIESGADVEEADYTGLTPLDWAEREGYGAIADLLRQGDAA